MTTDSVPFRRVAGIVLAAGAATRMGQLKQLLPYRGETLLRHGIRQALAAGLQPLIVVLGAREQDVRRSLDGLPLAIVWNERWADGMGGSIRSGVAEARRLAPEAAALGVLLGDQPLVRSEQLVRMQQLLGDPACAAVAAEYGGKRGVPAFFKPAFFAALEAVPLESGAHRLLHHSGADVVGFPLPEAAFDIDTPADLDALTKA